MSEILRRPTSFSESYIYFNEAEIQNEINTRKTALIEMPIQKIAPPIFTWFEFGVDYSLRFVGHVFLISIFEALFFFAFVSKDEDKGILATTNYYTNSIINSCAKLNVNESEFLNLLLGKFVNSTAVLAQGSNSAASRVQANTILYNMSWSYVGILGGVQIILLCISWFNKFEIKWRHIILENLALVGFLGIYEFMFFETVIKKYSTETPQEITAMFIKGLQEQCGILTRR
jgi:hypothetical protein